MPTLFSPTTKTRTGEFNGKQMGVGGRALGMTVTWKITWGGNKQ